MTLPRTVSDVVTDHVVFEVECIDHVAVGHPLVARKVEVRCLAHREPALSDHDAVIADVDVAG